MLAEQPSGSSRLGADDNVVARSATESNERWRSRSRRSRGNILQLLIEDLPGWWLAVLIVAAPWAYGTTFPETKELLAKALCGLGMIFLCSLLLRGRGLRINWVSLGLSFLILGYGWWMTWNATLVYDPGLYYFHPGSPPVPTWPGSVDQKTSWNQMVLITGLFCAFWTASDLGTRDRWRRRLWLVLSLTGISIIVLGLLQRLSGAPGIFWRTDLDCGITFFATYRYHANAGAFINIVVPLVAALSACSFRKDSSQLAKAFWLLALLVVLVSAVVNVSRAATVITLCVVAVFCAQQLYELVRWRRHAIGKRLLLVSTVLVLGGVATLVWLIGFGEAYKHWAQFGDSFATNGRFIVYDRIEHYALPAAGWWGFGPATFQLVFPFFTNGLGVAIQGFWQYAHEDYLQCLTEWGIAGTAIWCLFFGNTIGRAVGKLWQRESLDTRSRFCGIGCLLALASVLAHATVDFPMQIASLQLYVSVILGLLASLQYADPRSHRRFKSFSGTESAEEPVTMNGRHLVFEERKK
jgi:Ca2+/Na+ antiporter